MIYVIKVHEPQESKENKQESELENIHKHLYLQDTKLNYIIKLLERLEKP